MTLATISNAQLVAARVLLGLTEREMALQAGMKVRDVKAVEDGVSVTNPDAVELLWRAYRRAGVAFIGTSGVNVVRGSLQPETAARTVRALGSNGGDDA